MTQADLDRIRALTATALETGATSPALTLIELHSSIMLKEISWMLEQIKARRRLLTELDEKREALRIVAMANGAELQRKAEQR